LCLGSKRIFSCAEVGILSEPEPEPGGSRSGPCWTLLAGLLVWLFYSQLASTLALTQ